ncbi:Sulfite exporter TauE/SafE [Phycisphaerae bacterium RAS1]|nr:Sulfite exporter TauE/SafE [Phycisphaerae bacterium RAS1]
MSHFDVALLTGMILVAALLYSSVGHAGASGYLAAMALMGLPATVMKPTALVLNILVASITTAQFTAAGAFSWRTFWPFAVASVPCAWLGGSLKVSAGVYSAVVGATLLVAAVRLAWSFRERPAREIHVPAALLSGGGVGFLAGVAGVGGGIFLSPLLLLTGWANTRSTAGVSAAFILVNSIAGLGGHVASLQQVPPIAGLWAAAAGVGGLCGSWIGSRRMAPQTLRRMLAVVLVIAGVKMVWAAV